jgi:hypothetical protein
LPPLTQILQTYQYDPAVIVNLAIKLLKPLRFTDVMRLASEESLIRALSSPAPSANLLGLTIIRKAAHTSSDVAILSLMKDVIKAFITTWLSSPSVEVGEQATQTLAALLETDCAVAAAQSSSIANGVNGLHITPISSRSPGQGLLWRRLLHDQDIYGLLIGLLSAGIAWASITSSDPQPEHILSRRQQSLAQARLLRLLPRLAGLDVKDLTRSDFADVHIAHGLIRGEEGILDFAVLQMVDKADVLMHITLIDCVVEMLEVLAAQMPLDPTNIEYLARLLSRVRLEDQVLYQSIEGLAVLEQGSEQATHPEVRELLIRLKDYGNAQ